MKNDEFKRNSISARQYFFILIQITVGTGILTLPRSLSKASGQNSWVSIILAGMVSLLLLILIYRLGKRFPKETIISYSQKVLGSILGKMVVAVFILYAIFTTGIAARIFASALTSYSLPRTPNPVIISFMIVISLYLNNQGLKVIGRLNEFLFFLLSPIFFTMLFVLGQIDFSNFQPVLNITWDKILEGSLVSSYSFLGSEILLLIFPFVEENKKIIHYSMWSTVVIISTYLYVWFVTFGYYGEETIQFVLWPTINIFKSLNVPFFGRLDFLFLFLWIAIAFTTISGFFFIASFSINRLFNFEDYWKGGLIVIIPVFLVSIFPRDIIEVFSASEMIAQLGVLFILLVPLLLIIVSKIRSVGGEDKVG